ncbi:hypothetical protein [Agromyces aureus]|uniref:Peptidase M4 domain-containing protein n=1 Tax=Agromyces aureus TaxID=453304 RepID=A0A191WEH0_9MICO|nr:hypothetical protein [Agromyces aureus]ANJ26675.1 hypothetical protein ATC03_08075 [Agromyces aureus]
MVSRGPIATVPLVIQDDSADLGTIGGERVPTRENRELRLPDDANDRFLDGPACRRLAVVDFDPETGVPLPPPAPFVPTREGALDGTYGTGDGPESPAALAVNAFGIAFRTIRMFEGADAIGRRVRWAFGGEQLLIVPRAGERANAAYDRRTRSLQFSSFTGVDGVRVHTALSRDIVAHECGHALLDAVQPSLSDRPTRESIAIHEAVADLIAVLMALESDRLRSSVLARSRNRIDEHNAFSSIAEEFGVAKPGPGGAKRHALRELANTGRLEDLARADPHELSTLLSAIYYDTLRDVFEARFARERSRRGDDGRRPTAAQAANKALGTAHLIFRRFVLRGIDYLPPGDLGFADVGRAAFAADRAIDAASGRRASVEVRRRRDAFATRFVTRGIVSSEDRVHGRRPKALDVPPERLEDLRDQEYAAYDYVGRHRRSIGIPAGLSFTVLPRIDATKRIGPADLAPQRELLVKVAWERPAAVRADGTRTRAVPVGATIAIGWADGRCLALVRSVAAEGWSPRRDAGPETARGPGDPGAREAPDAPDAPDAQDEAVAAANGPAHAVDLLEADAAASGLHGAAPVEPTPTPPARATTRAAAREAARRPLAAPPPGVDPGAFFDLVRARTALRGR